MKRLLLCMGLILMSCIGPALAGTMEYDIFFKIDKADLRVDSKKTLDDVAGVLMKSKSARVTMEGHASTPADRAYNQALSARRVAAAKAYLVATHGIAANRIAAASFGEDKPKWKEETVQTRKYNQRVHIRIDLEERTSSVYTSVVDKTGSFMSGLNIGNFAVQENGRDVKIISVTFESESLGSNVGLVLDQSGSMKNAIDDLKRAARRFVVIKKPRDRVHLLAFSMKTRVLSEFENDAEKLDAAIGKLSAAGNTVLYDAVFQSAETLGRETGPKLMLLMTDGVDEGGLGAKPSAHTLAQAIDALKRNNVTAYVVGLGDKVDRSILNKVAAQTEGVAYFTTKSSELESLYAKVAAGVLKGKYKIDYQTELDEGERGTVVVKSKAGQVTGTYY